MRKNVVIFGLGNLGRRHLEALIRASFPMNIYGIDPSRDCLESSRILVADMAISNEIAIEFYAAVERLPQVKFDYVVNATTSMHRFDSIKGLVSIREVRHMLLEKVLFQNLDDYDRAAELLSGYEIKCWVNTPRRANEFYQGLPEKVAGSRLISMEVKGANWGMGSNAVHYLDLLSFYNSDNSSLTIDTSELDYELASSKRDGFKEISGCISGQLGDTKFLLDCAIDDSEVMSVELILDFEGFVVRLFETEGRFEVYNSQGLLIEESEFRFPYLSEFATGFAESIIRSGYSELPTYEISARLHFSFISSLSLHFGRQNPCFREGFPIT